MTRSNHVNEASTDSNVMTINFLYPKLPLTYDMEYEHAYTEGSTEAEAAKRRKMFRSTVNF